MLSFASSQDDKVITREGPEDGGWVFVANDGQTLLRAWAIDVGADMDAPVRRGQAYRFGPVQIAQRVMQAKNERLALLTDGTELRILFRDPARRESHVAISLERDGWRGKRHVPDSYRLLLALGSPAGVAFVPDLVEKARLAQARVTATLRAQAKAAVQSFLQELLDDPRNAAFFARLPDKQQLARDLYRDALVIVYRLLFILKLEASSDVDRSFSFSSVGLWRNTYSPSVALAPLVRKSIDEGVETGEMIGGGLRTLFRMFREGFSYSEMKISRLGGMLFGENAAPLLDDETLQWSERAAARLLDALLWTPRVSKEERQRVHYGPMDVEDLGRVYEALLELEPGLATEPMCRLRRQKLEVVVPRAQGEAYRQNVAGASEETDDEDETEEEDDKPAKGKTRVVWVEDIREGAFCMRVGLGRKASGSYCTPHAFVRFLILETLGPQIAERSPEHDPHPLEILQLKVLDPAMGSGHFLVEACRYLGEELYKACWYCDKRAKDAEEAAERASGAERDKHLYAALSWRKRVMDLPDPNDEMLAYLPSRVREGEESGVSEGKAKALCRRLVAVHCLYGVDKNPLAVELAKLSLWLESYAEGLPLTFLDHRLIEGDSLTGPMFSDLGTSPKDKSNNRIGDLYLRELHPRLSRALGEALVHVRDLEATIGKDVADIERKRLAKRNLDQALAPFLTLAAAWSGGVMLGARGDDAAYERLMEVVATNGDVDGYVASEKAAMLREMIATGRSGISYDLRFPEVFYPGGNPGERAGFCAVVGNPPWDAIQFKSKEFMAAFDLKILDAPTLRERADREHELLKEPHISRLFDEEQERFEQAKRVNDRLYAYQKVIIDDDLAGRQLDAYRVFMERNASIIRSAVGRTGVIVPAAFHANAGAIGIRRLYIDKLQLLSCFSFENRAKVFEIDSRFKFAVIVATAQTTKSILECAFYLHDPNWLFTQSERLFYGRDFIGATGGDYLTLLELRDSVQAEILKQIWSSSLLLGTLMDQLRITPNTSELPMLGPDVFREAPIGVNTRDPAVAAHLVQSAIVPLHEGKTFHQYDDQWGDPPRYVASLYGLRDRPRWLTLTRYYRLVYRAIAASTNERTAIACLLPPPCVNTRKAASDITAQLHSLHSSLMMLGILNAFALDYALRAMVQTDVSLFIVKRLSVPIISSPSQVFLAHAALRLSCNHEGYAPLWKEQLGDETWRESTPKHSWPVLAGDDARWDVRATIDAVVADAYGLSREQYQHVLGSFSHKSYPKAPEKCLAAFDDLKQVGLDAFVRKHDPYHDIPLNENLPKPVIELQIPGGPAEGTAFKLEMQDAAPGKKRGAKKKA